MGTESEIKAKFNLFFNGLKKEGIISAKLTYHDLEINYTPEGGSKIAGNQNKTENIAYPVKPAPVRKSVPESVKVKTDWEKAIQENSVASFDDFIKSHPKSSFTDSARKKKVMVKKLDQDAWQSINKIDDKDSYLWYLKEFPAGIYQKEAKIALKRLKRGESLEKIDSFSNLSRTKNNNIKIFTILFAIIVAIAIVGYFVIIEKEGGLDPGEKKIGQGNNGKTEISTQEKADKVQEKDFVTDDNEQQAESKEPIQGIDNNTVDTKETSADIKHILTDQEQDQSKTRGDQVISETGEVKSEAPIEEGKQTVVKKVEIKKKEPIEKKKEIIETKKEVLEIKKPDLSDEIKTIPFFLVSKSIIQSYRAKMKRLIITGLRRGVKVSGQIRLQLNIDQTGKLSVMRFDNRAFSVDPRVEKQTLVRLILRKIVSTKVKAPLDRKGKIVKVNRWILSYSVGFFKRNIILNLQN